MISAFLPGVNGSDINLRSTSSSSNISSNSYLNVKDSRLTPVYLSTVSNNELSKDYKYAISYSDYTEYSTGITNAINLELFIEENFFVSNIHDTRVHDLAVIHQALSSIDLFFTTNDTIYIDYLYWYVNDSLLLLDNNTLIATKDSNGDYNVFAYDNLYLALLYEKLSFAYNLINDNESAIYFEGKANKTMLYIDSLFYSASHNFIATNVTLDQNTYAVKAISPYTTAEITGLYGLACMGLKAKSLYYNKVEHILNRYFDENTTIVTIDSNSYRVAIKGTSPDNNKITDLTGNAYFASAYFALSSYLNTTGNNTYSQEFFFRGEDLLISSMALLYVPTYNLYASQFNITSNKQLPEIMTADCSILAMALQEYNRLHKQYFGYSLGSLSMDIIKSLDKNFHSGNTFDAGLSTQQGTLGYKIDDYKRNPIIVNSLGLSAESRYYPFIITLSIPDGVKTNSTIVLQWKFEWLESRNIFSFSKSSFNISYTLQIDSDLNFTPFYDFYVHTTAIDGNTILNASMFNLSAFAIKGGEHQISFSIQLEDNNVYSNSFFITIMKNLRVYTDPANIVATQGIDDYLQFNVITEDETGALVPKADIFFTYLDNYSDVKTDEGGSYQVNIPLKTILSFPEFQEQIDVNPRFEIQIYAWKQNYVDANITTIVTIRRNALNLVLSQELVVKRGQDLTLGISVQPQIQTLVKQPKARILLNDKELTSTTSSPSFYVDPKKSPQFLPMSLPVQVTLPTAKLKENANLTIVVTSLNFPVTVFQNEIVILPLSTLEAIYYWFNVALSSTWVKVAGSLGVVWAILWKQFQLYVLKTLRKCPYCGETMKTKYAVCRYCGNIIDKSRYSEIKSSYEEFSKQQIKELETVTDNKAEQIIEQDNEEQL